ncbi:MAG: right-handed parallel beta-helix repeat-containing protein [Verrucomicrobia bacterium]|nr:right-handed parallel beta-helix repeat-containing protein [Verrucomicrobiota bacterium]
MLLFFGGTILSQDVMPEGAPTDLYPSAAQRTVSPGHTTYYVDPKAGDDSNSGLQADRAWRSFKQVNRRLFAAGDRISVLAPGAFNESLMPMGAGTIEAPVEINLAPGRYDFYPTNALKLKLHISNDNDDPYTPKAIALCFKETRHFRISGRDTDIYVHGKMIETMFDHAEDVTLRGLSFDYHRPTVSEFTVLAVSAEQAEVQVHRDSLYALENGKLIWVGEGWRSAGLGLSQECDPVDGRVWRRDSPLRGVTRVEELAPFKLRLHFTRNPGLRQGRVLQFRETFRDCAGGFVLRSKDITWRNCAYHFMHGLGIVSQFSENLTFDHVNIAPRRGSGRTCAGWADLLHFSGCRGKIQVNDCEMSGTNDDPINVHGTHLRIVGRPAANQVLVRFMHPQSYGFEAFVPGDEIELVNHLSLRAYATNRVQAAQPKGDKDILLTLERPAPVKIEDNDVVENVTWTPSVEVRNCTISLDSCRGFLLTTRRPILIENNTFVKTTMSAILIADDANSWLESGPVHDVTIRGNRFLGCAEPVIAIAPENHVAHPEEPVHQNIRILENSFTLIGQSAISARSTQNLVIQGNRFSTSDLPIHTNACSGVTITENKLGVQKTQTQPKPGD